MAETTVILLLFLLILLYVDFVQDERNKLQNSIYKAHAQVMKQKLEGLILNKQKATIAIAISVANDKNLVKDIVQNNISDDYYKELVSKYRTNTLYKNIWIQILDKDLNSLHKSWIDGNNTKIIRSREDLKSVLKTKEPTYSISSGGYDLSIKAIVPILDNGKIIKILEVISHFNSISKQMKEFSVDSVVVLNKEETKDLIFPFTKMFIGEYYIANFDAPSEQMDYLKNNGIENYFNNSYRVENEHLIVSYALKNINNKTIGHYIMFKKIDGIVQTDLDFLIFKWLALALVVLGVLVAVVSSTIFYENKRQKLYYKNVIDNSLNIVLILDKKTILDVNEVFFKYFDKYHSIQNFNKEHESISDFFVKEKGCLQKDMDGVNWLDYLLKHSNQGNRVKLKYGEKIYYFIASASLISEEKKHYSVILSDITREEKYQQELKYTSITDSLTKIKNRHYYNQQIKAETSRASRHHYPLSLIMFDIDFFKKVNDKYGHDVGDGVLIEYTKLISSFLRDSDIFCRTGGEEFVVILAHTNKNDAYKLAQKLKSVVETHEHIVPITISCGVVEYIRGEDLDYTYKRVDDALYKAKKSGRNRVVLG